MKHLKKYNEEIENSNEITVQEEDKYYDEVIVLVQRLSKKMNEWSEKSEEFTDGNREDIGDWIDLNDIKRDDLNQELLKLLDAWNNLYISGRIDSPKR